MENFQKFSKLNIVTLLQRIKIILNYYALNKKANYTANTSSFFDSPNTPKNQPTKQTNKQTNKLKQFSNTNYVTIFKMERS